MTPVFKNPLAVIEALENADMAVDYVDGKIRCQPRENLTPALRAAVSFHREEILAILELRWTFAARVASWGDDRALVKADRGELDWCHRRAESGAGVALRMDGYPRR